MNNKIEIFKNEELGQIKIAFLDDGLMFNLYDSCWNLGYTTKNNEGRVYLYKNRIEKICSTLEITSVDVVSTIKKPITKDIDFENTWIDEQSFYDLCLESKAKNARSFRRWVTGEVLPSIRKTGSYCMDNEVSNEISEEVVSTRTNVENIKVIDIALSTVLKVMDEAQINPMSKFMAVKEFYKRIGLEIPLDIVGEIKEDWYSVEELAEMCGIFSKNGRPAKEALTYVLSQLDIDPKHKLQTWTREKGYKKDTIKYKKDVMLKIAEWFTIRFFPTIIEGGNREYEVTYKSMKN